LFFCATKAANLFVSQVTLHSIELSVIQNVVMLKYWNYFVHHEIGWSIL